MAAKKKPLTIVRLDGLEARLARLENATVSLQQSSPRPVQMLDDARRSQSDRLGSAEGSNPKTRQSKDEYEKAALGALKELRFMSYPSLSLLQALISGVSPFVPLAVEQIPDRLGGGLGTVNATARRHPTCIPTDSVCESGPSHSGIP
jgi:hypothetical protein